MATGQGTVSLRSESPTAGEIIRAGGYAVVAYLLSISMSIAPDFSRGDMVFFN